MPSTTMLASAPAVISRFGDGGRNFHRLERQGRRYHVSRMPRWTAM